MFSNSEKDGMKRNASALCAGVTLVMFLAAGTAAALVCLVLMFLFLPTYHNFVDRL